MKSRLVNHFLHALYSHWRDFLRPVPEGGLFSREFMVISHQSHADGGLDVCCPISHGS